MITILVDELGRALKGLEKSERIGIQRKNQVHLDHGIVEISQNTTKNPGDRRILAVTQTPVKANADVKKKKKKKTRKK